MSKVDSKRKRKSNPRGARVRVFGYTVSLALRSLSVLVATLSLVFSSALYAQSENEVVEFDIPASTLPQALRAFARQSRIELVFAERGYDNVMTQAVVGSYQRERALEMLLAGTGLSVGFGSGDSVIVQRAQPQPLEAATELAVGRLDDEAMLLAQAVATSTQTSSDFRDVGHQDSSTTLANPYAESDQILDEIVTTGSRIRGAQSASPVVTIDRAEIEMAGFATVEEVVEYLPQNFGAGAGSDIDTTNSTNLTSVVGGDVRASAGGTSVNLRGLGPTATLVLLNGRRISPSGISAGFTNIGSIPITAIERIEVMTDGASAIYGADAIAGVVNFILRDDYEGAETRLRYGSDAGGDTSNVQFGQTLGTSWSSGSALLSYEYFETEALASTDRAFTASNDLRPFGGTDWRQPGGSPANVEAGGQIFAIPDGQDGTSLTPADFVGLENTQNLQNLREGIDITPNLERHGAFLHVTQDVGAVKLFGAARFALEESTSRNNAVRRLNFTVTDASPWFVDPTGTGLTQVRVLNYSVAEEAGSLEWLGEIDTHGATLGAEVEFVENWSGELTLNWSREEALQSVNKQLGALDGLPTLLASVNLDDPTLAFNPFSDGSNANNRAILDQLFNSPNPSLSYENELWSASLDVNGDVFDIGGGTAKLAAGVDFRRESLFTVAGLSFPSSLQAVTDLSRDISAVYAELFLPLVSQSNSRPGLRLLEVSLAARHEDFSDFGSSTNPKLGFVWSPFQSLTFRGTYGTSFRAPALDDLDESRGTRAFYLPAQFFGSSILLASGRNAGLDAEEATSWTTGIQWTPDFLRDMTLELTYFDVEFTGRIDVPFPSTAVGLAEPERFPTVVIASPTPDQIAAIVNSPIFSEGRIAAGSPDDFISGAIPIDFILDNRLTNLAESHVTGLELLLSYAVDSRFGTFSAGINGSYMLDYKRKLLDSDPLIDEVDTYGRPVDFRARGNVGWRLGNWSVSGFVNYVDGYTDSASGPARPDDPRPVDSWTTVDLTVAYQTGSDSGFLSSARISLTTQNFFDEDPPFVDTAGGVGYDAVNANPMGRFFALSLTKEW